MKMLKKTFPAVLCLVVAHHVSAQNAPGDNAKAENGISAGNDTLQTDTADYRAKMHKLQDEMRSVQREMSRLRNDESRRNAEHVQARVDRMKSSSDNGEHIHEHDSYSYMRGDEYIDKKIASGEVKEKIKPYTKSYTIGASDKIQIENIFGKVVVNTWAKNEVKVDVEIKADGDNDAEAQKLLDKVTIKDTKESENVSFRTDIERNDEDNNWGSWSDSSHTHIKRVVVNYTIYMPAKNALSIANKFGEVTVPDMTGKVTLDLKFTNLTAQQLSNPLNDVTVKFGNATIASLNSEAFNIAYGNAKIGTADKLKAKVSFAGLDVDKLTSSGDVTLKYTRGGTGFKVGELDKNLKSLNIDASFSKVMLNPKDNFDFDVSTKMGGFNYDNASVNVTSKTTGDDEHRYYNPNKNYKGHAGKGGADRIVTIKSNYTSIKFDQ